MENFSLALFLLCFLSLHLSSSSYTLPSEYFISCGSDTNISYTTRNFVGDSNSKPPLSFTLKGKSTPLTDTTKNSQTLDRTARIFRGKSSYEFKISNPGIYVVRLHFFAFNSSNYNLSSASFDVSASGFFLLENFTLNNRKPPNLVEEFLLSLNIGKFTLQFLPRLPSFAFVNAIEVFLAPENFLPDEASHVIPAGRRSNYEGILSKVLQTIHRINVGGLNLTPDNDTLWRYWVPDDDYLYMPETAKDAPIHSGKPEYPPGVDEFIAPDQVYLTAKEMNLSSDLVPNNFNITWSFNVKKNAIHFVRVHFCDIISPALSEFAFNLYIYNKFGLKIFPYEEYGKVAAAFYKDFVVDSDDSGLLNISIGSRADSDPKNAFLNGVEILEIAGESPKLKDEHKKINVIVLLGSILGGFAVISILAIGVCLCLRCRKQKSVEVLDCSPVLVHKGGSSHNRVAVGSPRSAQIPDLNLGLRIPLAEIMFATNNFNPEMIVGKGGFGYVFRGTLRNGIKVAVKRSQPGSGQGLPEFQTEIMVLSKVRHRHLVSLIGYCDEMSEMILVYEFMENGTLRDHLYNSNLPSLSWTQRLEICIGSAKGLHYLHRGSAGRFIHRDVKSTNILLDENLVAKVGDFGLLRIGSPDETHVSTNVKGTFGYVDPDYFRTLQLTEKSDVYSFGVVLFEVLCARPPINPLLTRDEVNLAEWGLLHKSKGSLENIIDRSIKDEINLNSLRKFADVAEKCLEDDGSNRPAMADVQWDLEYALQLQQNAIPIREPHEDSATDASGVFLLPNVQRLRSLSMSIEGDDMPTGMDNSSSMWASDVFSQLRVDDAR
ncbi:probable receptor-like protein kinase At5g24010 [Euphorbia lathyris]|uniref:probable receptor-like protein kinase At5g24010 n=1 Tax=Euphorbia lathyris TaxID=212925 RepID=UPI0033138E7F